MRKIIIRGAIVVVILLAGTGVFQWHNYQQKIEYRKEALLYFKEEDYSKESRCNRSVSRSAQDRTHRVRPPAPRFRLYRSTSTECE